MHSRFSLLAVVFALFAATACTSDAQDTGMGHDSDTMHTAAHGDMPPRANDEARVSPNASVSQTIGTTNVMITYGRPSVNDRVIYGELVPYGEVWRTGANEATVFHTSGDVTVNGEALAAGTYALFTIPDEDSWTVIFNSQPAQWGAYNRDAEQDVLAVEANASQASMAEQLTFSFQDVTADSATVLLHWADRAVALEVATAE